MLQGRSPTFKQGLAVFAGTCLIFGLIVAFVTGALRQTLRKQIVQRDAEVLQSLVMLEMDQATERGELGKDISEFELFGILLDTSKMRGVFALRLYDPAGLLLDNLPYEAVAGDVREEAFDAVLSLEPYAVWEKAAPMSRYFVGGEEEDKAYPVLEVNLPVFRPGEGHILAIAQYVLNGEKIEAEYNRLDASLIKQAGVAVLGGAALMGLLIAYTFNRLARAHRTLEERNLKLTAANATLSQAMRSTAVGAISAHMLHELKNPLSGLTMISQSKKGQDPVWDAISTSTTSMQGIIHEVLSVLHQEDDPDAPHSNGAELTARLKEKFAPVTESSAVNLEINLPESRALDPYQANILYLVLANLANNAMEAMEHEGRIVIHSDDANIYIKDNGKGLPENVQRKLFKPVKSTKEGGTGLGLVISHELAKSIGSDLALNETGPGGTVFTVSWPKEKVHDVPAA